MQNSKVDPGGGRCGVKSSVLRGDDDEEGGDESGQGAVREETGGPRLANHRLAANFRPSVKPVLWAEFTLTLPRPKEEGERGHGSNCLVER